jgi:pantothenate kinase type III
LSNSYLFLDVGNSFVKVFYLKDFEKKLFKNIFHIFSYIDKNNIVKIKNKDIEENDYSDLNNLIKEILKNNNLFIYYIEVNFKIFSKLERYFQKFSKEKNINLSFEKLSYFTLNNKYYFNYKPKESYGSDRIALLLYSYHLNNYFSNVFKSIKIFNFGTAMTIENIEENRYLGGLISLSFFSELKTFKIFTDRIDDLTYNWGNFYNYFQNNIKNLLFNFLKKENNNIFELKEINIKENLLKEFFDNIICNNTTKDSVFWGSFLKFLNLFDCYFFSKFSKNLYIFGGDIFNFELIFLILIKLYILNNYFYYKNGKNFGIILLKENTFLLFKISYYKNYNKISIKKMNKIKIYLKNGDLSKKYLKIKERIEKIDNLDLFLFDNNIPIKGLILEIILKN